MIKGISFLQPTADRAAHDRLGRFFAALGFASGRGWQEEQSQGGSFLAPLGNIELVHGEMPPFARIAVEVTSLDSAHQAAAAWMRSEGIDSASALSAVAETHWKASYFTAQPVEGNAVSFWAWNDPL